MDSSNSFVSAVRQKYCSTDIVDNVCSDNSFQPVDATCVIYCKKMSHQNSDIDEPALPSLLSLTSCSISNAGPTVNIAQALRSVQDLDISMNYITQWQEVFSIIAYMPTLRILNLSNNPLCESHPIVIDKRIDAFNSIRHLVLNGLKLTWQTIVQLLDLMPQIQELHLSFNQYSTVEIPDNKTYPSLTDVHLSSNEIHSLSDIRPLGCSCPNLSNLVLINNPLSQIGDTTVEVNHQTNANDNNSGSRDPDTQRVDAEDEAEPDSEVAIDDEDLSETLVVNVESCFPALKSLVISNTQLASWEELEKLALMPKLTDVKINGIDFFEKVEEELRRQLAISYLQNIKKLNGSNISSEERDKAHRVFVRHYMNCDEKPTRYYELESQLGRLDPLADVSLKPPHSVLVTCYFEEMSIVKRFSLKMTAGEVKRILSNELVGQPAIAFDLHHRSLPHGAEKMRFMQKSLQGYNLRDDDEFYVFLKR